jgi:chemotaxis family two-component system response regulator Rcp1
MDSSKLLSEHIGRKIRDRRQRAGMSLAILSQKLGVSLHQLEKYEFGINRVSPDVLNKLQHIFNVPIDFFFDGFESEDKSTTKFIDPETISYTNKSAMNILLVEDNAGDEFIMRKFIEECDYPTNIFSAHDGKTALELLRQDSSIPQFIRADIVILDLNIPKRDGHTVLKEIKRDERIQDIPVIIITNSLKREEMIRVYKKYASGYICKSGDLDTFKSQIQTLIRYWSFAVVLPRMSLG